MAGSDPPDETRPGDASQGAQIRTFLIADVRGYTLFTQERGDEAAAKLAGKFADISRETVEGRGGTLLELRGDEALCVFSSTRDAIRAAVEMQERFVDETVSAPELPLTVGIGLDAGEAVAVQGGYRGGALNLAARLCGEARAGEILASREVTHLARRLDGLRYEERGALTFKGISDPVAVVRIVPEGADPAERLRPFAPPAPPPVREPSRKRTALIAGGVAVALVAISIPLLRSGDGELVAVGANSIARIDPADGRVDVTTALEERPGATAVGFGSLWVAQPDRGVVVRLDLEDGTVRDTIRVGNSPAGVAAGEGSVWVTNAGDASVSRINPESGLVTRTLEAGSGPAGIAVGAGAVWVADGLGGNLLRIDPTTEEAEPVALPGQPSGVAFTPEAVWVAVSPAKVVQVDPENLSAPVIPHPVGGAPSAVLAAFGSLWVANHLDGTVSRLEPSTGRVVATIPVGQGPSGLAEAEGAVWVANEFDGSVTLIDPERDAVDRTIPIGGAAASLVAGGGGVWVAVGAAPGEHRGGTLHIASRDTLAETLDPAVVYAGFGSQVLSVTNDGLLAYRKVGGPAGATLVPDLASALPQVSDDGLTYRFPLRSGMKYSTGEPVRPEDFRHGLERSLALSGAGALYDAIAGAKQCTEKPAACDLSESFITDEAAVTITLTRPDSDLPHKLALPFAFPVPTSVPAEDQRLDPVPATGPYMIKEVRGGTLELVRNPEFEEWSGAAQPEGFVDRIVWQLSTPTRDRPFDRLESGDLDWLTEVQPADELTALQAAHPNRVVLSPQPFTLFVGFNVRKAPFDDVRVRQAVNFAIDREEVVELMGGPTTQRATCQILPPNFVGYEPFCPYTEDPGSVWSAPDLDRARALIREADAEGAAVVASVTTAPGYVPPGSIATMRHVVETLNQIGLRATLKTVPDGDAYFQGVFDPRGPQMYVSGWISDYPGAANFLDLQFRCDAGANSTHFCDEDLDGRMDEALALQTTDLGAAARAWMEIEHELVEQAVWAPLTNPLSANAFSERTGNIQVHPQWGVLLSRLWVQ